MKQFGHGPWISIEREAARRADASLTFDRIKETMSRTGAHKIPDNKTLGLHLAGIGVPQGKTRLAYEKFWRGHASATPISRRVRLADIDDSQRHSDLLHDFSRLCSSRKVKATNRSKLVTRWHEYVRSLEVRLELLERLIKVGVPTIEDLYQCYRCHYRLADILYEGQKAGLPLPNGQTSKEIDDAVRDHYGLAWERANDALKRADQELRRLNDEKVAREKEEALLVDGDKTSNLNTPIFGMRIMRDLFVLGYAAAAENRVSLALKESNAKDAAEWRGKLRSTCRRGQHELDDHGEPADKLLEASLFALNAVFAVMNAAFENHCAIEFARDRLAFVAAMFVLGEKESPEPTAKKDLEVSLRVLREAIHDSGKGQAQRTAEQLKWLIGLPTIQNIMHNRIISKKEIEHVLAHS
jgi:hypothetical protein